MNRENAARAAQPRRTCWRRGTTGRRPAVIAAAAALAAVAGLTVPATASATPGGIVKADGRYAAEIDRTAYGIPHILARDYGSYGYGYGYPRPPTRHTREGF